MNNVNAGLSADSVVYWNANAGLLPKLDSHLDVLF